MTDHLGPHDAALTRLRALHPQRIDLSLGRMRRLAEALGHPERRLPPVIHVAGTNGKGSTVACLRAIAEAAGLRVHVFTSPHLVRFVERIRLAGKLIEEAHLAEVLERVEAANAGQPITFFEITAAAAFLAFAETPADLLLLEVGLGGVLDATNIIEAPAVSVIAPIDIDHREFLGDTLAAIAGEKAGIIKRGVPVVSARQRPDAEAVVEARAAALAAPLSLMGRDFDAWRENGRMVVQLEDRLLDLPLPALAGEHQIDNAAVAVAAALALGDLRIEETAIAEGVASAVWPARFQRLTAGPLADMAKAAGAALWLDGGHNPHAGAALARTLESLQGPKALVSGLLANKDAQGFFAAFAGQAPPVFAVEFHAETAAPAQATAVAARRAGLTSRWCETLTEGVARALEAAPGGHVLICGSLHLAGEVLAMSEATWPT